MGNQLIDSNGIPLKKEVCLQTQLLCNSVIKVVGVKVIEPYTFWMKQDDWNLVAKNNALEYNLALKFCLENDMSVFSDDVRTRQSFDTMMYVKFNRYLKENAIKKAGDIVREFEQKTWLTMPKSIFSAAKTGLNLSKKTLNVVDVMKDATLLANNNGPITINENMYMKIFKVPYDSGMIHQLHAEDVI